MARLHGIDHVLHRTQDGGAAGYDGSPVGRDGNRAVAGNRYYWSVFVHADMGAHVDWSAAISINPLRQKPDVPLPPYSYVTGHFPHPTRDPAGHMAGHVPQAIAPPDPAWWRQCHEYIRGLDLFNYGYYWEAHEAWEALWHAVGRGGLLGDFLKGLIKLAAAGVKVREGRTAGVERHARRAEELFNRTAERLPSAADAIEQRLLGLSIDELRQIARRVAENPPRLSPRDRVPPVEIVFDFRLVPK